MGKPQRTKSQEAAVASLGKTVLVSAGAGAGKSTNLADRISESIEKHGADISRMLVVTFTTSAAAELRKKIADALRVALERETGAAARRRLSGQLLRLPAAQISTIDSFCVNAVRTYAATLGVSASFRIAEGSEIRLLKNSVMRNVAEECLNDAALPRFHALADVVRGASDDDSLETCLLEMYEKCQNYPDGIGVYTALADRFAKSVSPSQCEWGKEIRRLSLSLLGETAVLCDAVAARLSEIGDRPEKFNDYINKANDLGTECRRMKAALSETDDYDAWRAAVTALKSFAMKSQEIPNYDEAVDARKTAKQIEKKIALLKELFPYSAAEWEAQMPQFGGVLQETVAVLSRFEETFEKEKTKRGIAEFTDIAHRMYRLLWQDGKKTAAAEEIGNCYDYIYVDEYQDVNLLQHRIFEAIAKQDNLFMVGDMKQCIYAFRGSQPDIFSSLQRTFAHVVLPKDGELFTFPPEKTVSIFFPENFRSHKDILAFANAVCTPLFTLTADTIPYEKERDELRVGSQNQSEKQAHVGVYLFEKESAEADADEESETKEDGESEESENTAADLAKEAGAVADEILRLRREEKEKTGENVETTAVMARRSRALPVFAEELKKRGIPVAYKNPQTDTPIFLLAHSLLEVVDNPRKDIPLAAVLRSPLFGFTLDELLLIHKKPTDKAEREAWAGTVLYESLVAYCQNNPTFEKGAYFLSQLARFRRKAEEEPVDRFLFDLYRASGLSALAEADESGMSRDSLLSLYDMARRYAAFSYHGLYQFLLYLDESIKRKDERDKATPTPGVVTVCTVHASKGLDFDNCFVVDAAWHFVREDESAKLLYALPNGVSFPMAGKRAVLENPLRPLVLYAMREKKKEEEIRILYVALTRAKTRLYVTATATKKDIKSAAPRLVSMQQSDLLGFESPLAMLLNALPESGWDAVHAEGDTPLSISPVPPSQEEKIAVKADASALDTAAVNLFKARFEKGYPDKDLCSIPGKVSVSALTPTLLDREEEGTFTLPDAVTVEDGDRQAKKAPLPRFLGGEEEGGKSAAEAGTATHLFMQFCDFARLEKDGVECELSRLVDKHFIERRDATLVRQNEIAAFLHSSLFAVLKGKGKLYRELRFHVSFPAHLFTKDEKKRAYYRESDAKVLVQGVMDGVLQKEDGSLLLFDYKTDRLLREEKENRAQAEEKLIARHGLQLAYYAAACRVIFGRLPDCVQIYSLALGDTVDVPLSRLNALFPLFT